METEVVYIKATAYRDYRVNPPREVYKYASWCRTCEDIRPKDAKYCNDCGRQLRKHPRRPSCKRRLEVKRI